MINISQDDKAFLEAYLQVEGKDTISELHAPNCSYESCCGACARKAWLAAQERYKDYPANFATTICYGRGGWARYHITANGDVYFSVSHARHKAPQAEAAGFTLRH